MFSICFMSLLHTRNGWETTHSLETLASWCSLSLLQVCPNLAAKTMCKARNDPRNDPRNDLMGELQVHQAGAIIFLYTLSCSSLQEKSSRRRVLYAEEKIWTWRLFHRRALATCSDDIGWLLA